jgi:hypothetical protein
MMVVVIIVKFDQLIIHVVQPQQNVILLKYVTVPQVHVLKTNIKTIYPVVETGFSVLLANVLLVTPNVKRVALVTTSRKHAVAILLAL